MNDIVDPDDLTVQRDADGEVLPETADAGRFGRVRVRPMSYGKVQEKFGDGQQFDFDADDLAQIFRDHIVEPDLEAHARKQGFDGVTGEYVNSFYPLAPRDLLMAVLDVSGVNADVEATEEGGAAVAVQGN